MHHSPNITPAHPASSKISLVVTDVDGTLLPSTHIPLSSSKTSAIILRLRHTHPTLPIVLSTGKQYSVCADIRKQLLLDEFYSCHLNGAVVHAPGGEVIRARSLGEDVVDAVITCGEGLLMQMGGGIEVYLYTIDKIYQVVGEESGSVCRGGGGWIDILRSSGENPITFASLVEKTNFRSSLPASIIKATICGPPAQTPVIRTQLSQHLVSGTYSVTQGSDFCVEILPVGCNKGAALTELLEVLALDREGVLAFGDGDNDVSMFEVAGMSVAMENAMEKPKACATWVTESNDAGGVGKFLERIFWPEAN